MDAGLYALRGVEMAHEWTNPMTQGLKYKVGSMSPQIWYRIMSLHLYLYYCVGPNFIFTNFNVGHKLVIIVVVRHQRAPDVDQLLV